MGSCGSVHLGVLWRRVSGLQAADASAVFPLLAVHRVSCCAGADRTRGHTFGVRTRAYLVDLPCVGGRGFAAWIRKVLADTTRRMEKQGQWAQSDGVRSFMSNATHTHARHSYASPHGGGGVGGPGLVWSGMPCGIGTCPGARPSRFPGPGVGVGRATRGQLASLGGGGGGCAVRSGVP